MNVFSDEMGHIKSMRKQSGITLIELLVVVAIVGIIVAVALPSYQAQTQATRRADAASVLMKCAISMGHHSSGNNYSFVGAAAGTTCSAKSPIDGPDTIYQITITNLTATTYTLSAIPQGGQASDGCGTLTLNQAGTQGASSGSVDDCWR